MAGRRWVDWTPKWVEEYPVASHRYLWSGTILADGSPAKEQFLCDSYSEAKANIPYKQGEVVYVERNNMAVKAIVVLAFLDLDSYGDHRECYRVCVETKAGQWSQLWERAWSGFIQRGYKRAGLAPDVKD